MKFAGAKIATLVLGTLFILSTSGASVPFVGPEFDSAVPIEIRQQLEDDFKLVSSFTGSDTSMYYQEIFKSDKIDGGSLLQFFDERVRTVGMNDCGGGPGIGACIQWQIEPTKMQLTENYVNFDIPQIFRISVVFHESRHTEAKNKFWLHANCPVPFLDAEGKDVVGIISGAKMQGTAACDYTAFGSYGMQAVLLKNIELHCDSCSEKIRMDAKLFGNDTLNRIVDPDIKESLLDDLQ